MEFEMVIEGYLFLSSLLDEVYPDVDFELSTPGFGNLERGLVDIWVTTGGYLNFVFRS